MAQADTAGQLSKGVRQRREEHGALLDAQAAALADTRAQQQAHMAEADMARKAAEEDVARKLAVQAAVQAAGLADTHDAAEEAHAEMRHTLDSVREEAAEHAAASREGQEAAAAALRVEIAETMKASAARQACRRPPLQARTPGPPGGLRLHDRSCMCHMTSQVMQGGARLSPLSALALAPLCPPSTEASTTNIISPDH